MRQGIGRGEPSVDDLTERIQIVYQVVKRNARGNLLSDGEVIRAEVWANILPLSGRITAATPERENIVTYRITIRHRTDVCPDDRVKWRGRVLKIVGTPIDVGNYHRWLQFDCIEVVPDGTH